MTKAMRRLAGVAAGLAMVVGADASIGAQPRPQPASTKPAPPASSTPPATAPGDKPKPAPPPVKQRPAVKMPDPDPQPVSSVPRVRVGAKRGQMLPEGTFLIARRGRMTSESDSASGDGWTFRFDPDAKGAAEAPMKLLPSETLESMQRLAASRAEAIDFAVSGQVFMYRGKNYLLPVYFEATESTGATPGPAPVGPPADLEADAEESEPSTQGPPAVETPIEDEAQRRIRELERNTRSRPRMTAPAASVAPAGGSETPAHAVSPAPALRTVPQRGGIVAEGTYLASRRGRLIRGDGGAWVIRFDADATGHVDPPMIALPCAKLQEMERTAGSMGDSASFTVSGQVYVYEGQNYLLPMLTKLARTNPDLLPGR